MAYEKQKYIDGWLLYADWLSDLKYKVNNVHDYDNDDGFRKRLMSCQSNRDRFELIWNEKPIKRMLESVINNDKDQFVARRSHLPKKSIADSKKMRDKGNESFKNGSYFEALKQYTQAIRLAPYPESVEGDDDSLAIALANRSAALYSLNRFRHCLADIELAIEYGYPKVNMFKLLIRKIKCLHILSVWTNDIEQIKDTLRGLLRKEDTKEFIRAEISGMFEFIEQTQPEDFQKDELDVVDETVMKLSNPSKTISQGADCIEMSYNCDKGRYLITNKDVSLGRLLLAETPFVSNLASSERDEYCYNCFERLHTCGLPCTDCTDILYCSINCLKESEPIHSRECGYFSEYQNNLGVAYLVVKIMFKIDFQIDSVAVHNRKSADLKPLDTVLNIPAGDWPDLVYKNSYASVLSLMDHVEDYEFDELFGYALTAGYIMTLLIDQFSPTVDVLNDPAKQSIMGSIVLRHILQLQTNLISVLDQNLQGMVSIGHSISEMQEKPIGVAIYPTISLLNHSCRPNIISIFHRNKFVARASKSLECGSEINFCYGPSYLRMSKKDRQERLKRQYFFTCDCDCCTNDIENECRALVCPKCQGPVIYNEDLTHKCMSCKSTNLLDIKDARDKLIMYKTRLEDLNQAEDGYETKMDRLKKLEGQLSKLAYWKNPMFAQIKSTLIEFAQDHDDLPQAIKYCQEEVELTDKTYGVDSFESIMSKMKAINFNWQHLYNCIESSQTEESKTQSIDELKELLVSVGSIRGKLKDLLNSTSIFGAENSFKDELKFLSDIQSNIRTYLASLDEGADESNNS